MRLYRSTFMINGRLVDFETRAEDSDEHFDAATKWADRVYPGHNIAESYVKGRFTEIHEDDAPV